MGEDVFILMIITKHLIFIIIVYNEKKAGIYYASTMGLQSMNIPLFSSQHFHFSFTEPFCSTDSFIAGVPNSFVSFCAIFY